MVVVGDRDGDGVDGSGVAEAFNSTILAYAAYLCYVAK